MKRMLILVLAMSLAGCAAFSGAGGQFTTTDTLELSKHPTRFYDDVIAVGQQLGYQHAGGNRAANLVRLADQPNFGESMIGRAYSVQVTVTLKPNGRTVEMVFASFGGRATSGADKSQERIEQLKAALRQRFGG